MKRILVTLIISTLLATASQAADDISPEKKNLIDTLLVQSGQSAMAVAQQFSDAFVQQMTVALKHSNPDVDPRAIDFISEEVNAVITEEVIIKGRLNQIMYPIYDQHFSIAELKQLVEFNNTELGTKLISVMPAISQEGMQAGMSLGESLGPLIQQRLLARFQAEGIQ